MKRSRITPLRSTHEAAGVIFNGKAYTDAEFAAVKTLASERGVSVSVIIAEASSTSPELKSDHPKQPRARKPVRPSSATPSRWR
jgi:hypothetical protein